MLSIWLGETDDSGRNRAFFLIIKLLLGSIGNFTFHMASMHSIMNFFLMCASIPSYRKGLRADIERLFGCIGKWDISVSVISLSNASGNRNQRAVQDFRRQTTSF
jgi:hypothetical protein